LSGWGAISVEADGVRIRVWLTPSGGADRIEGFAMDAAGEEHLKARVRVAPEHGAANAALEALLAKVLRVPRSAVQIERGHTARVKLVGVDGLTLDEDSAKLTGEGS
jgi:uncharacterized protein YggU (UPF0235/DUF167 family)